MKNKIKTAVANPPLLAPMRLCETRSGDIAYVIGRCTFRRGRPVIVEHLGGVYLEHCFRGRVLTPGYDSAFDIVMLYPAEDNKNDNRNEKDMRVCA